MPFVFRKIRRAKWLPSSRPSWLAEGELQADALGDLHTSTNMLSMYIIDNDLSNLERVAAAIATTADNPSNLDYVLLDLGALAEIGVSSVNSPGETPDDVVNSSHLDLTELSASKLLHLANLISSRGQIARIQEKKIISLIVQNIHSGNFAREKVNLRKSKSFWEALDK